MIDDKIQAKKRLRELPTLIRQTQCASCIVASAVKIGMLKAEKLDLESKYPDLKDIGDSTAFFKPIFGDWIK